MTHDEVRALLLSFPGVEDGTSYDEPSYKAAGKFFTWMWPKAPGDNIVLVLASSAHSAEALAATEYLIDRLKTDVMLWKRETFADGCAEWVEQRESDQDRAGRWG